jgi:hypothetical protein
VALEARSVHSTGPGTGEWIGVITDDEIYGDVLELLSDAIENGWAVSWLPTLDLSVWITEVQTEARHEWVDVTVMGGPPTRLLVSRHWEITISLSWENPNAIAT